MKKRESFIAYAEQIKALGYRVFVINDPYWNYGWIVNEKDEIGYFKLGDFGFGIMLSTVHKPCHEFGTGFSCMNDSFDYYTEFTREIIDRCFAHHFNWVNGNLNLIRKWTATEFFQQLWNKDKVIEL